MDEIQVSNPALWTTLASIFGPGGLVLLITNAAAWYGTYLIWGRLKEKDAECHGEMNEAELRWETRFQQMRGDVKEGFSVVARLTDQVTVLAERSRS